MLVLLLFPIAAQADYQDGLNAYSDGNYRLAMREWKTVTGQPPGEVNPAIYAEAHYAVARLYWDGLGTPRDYYGAHEWLLKAVELEHAGAMAKLGFMYTDGIVVGQDFGQAFHWYSEAARLGDIDGLYNLGICYLNGWGTERDATLAKQYLAAASALGDPASEQALAQLLASESEHSGSPEPVTEEIPHQVRDDDEPPVGASLARDQEHPEADHREQGSLLHSEDWILNQNPQSYTIQAIALSNREKLEGLLEGHENLAPMAVYTVQNRGQPLFVLVAGVFPSVEDARAARDRFPAAINPPEQVWIRRFERVQAIIRAEQGE